MRKKKKSKIKRLWDEYTEGWFGVLVYLFLGFVIAYGVNFALGIVLSTNTPVVAVFSNSMVPTFYRGDMIIVYGEENLKVGDVVIFDSPDKKYPIIHRINEIRDGGIITKGDNVASTDEGRWGVIPLDKIRGKAFLKIPILGFVKIWFVELTGFG